MRHVSILAAIAAVSISSSALAAVNLDGSRDGDYGAPLAVQTVETQFGDNFSELNAAYARIEGGTLFVMLTGNLENNFNKLNIFIDSQAGGENVLTKDTSNGGNNPTNDGWANKHGGMKFDTGFAADYMLILRNGSGKFDIDFSSVGNAGTVVTASNVFGFSTQGANASALSNGIGVAFNNSNTAGVLGGTAAADQVAAAAVTTGIELAIPMAAIGAPLGDIRISAMVNGSNHDYLSNQFLGGLAAPQGNLGGNGNGDFFGDLSRVNLDNFAGNQFFTVVVPEPSTLGLAGVAGLAALRRRRA